MQRAFFHEIVPDGLYASGSDNSSFLHAESLHDALTTAMQQRFTSGSAPTNIYRPSNLPPVQPSIQPSIQPSSARLQDLAPTPFGDASAQRTDESDSPHALWDFEPCLGSRHAPSVRVSTLTSSAALASIHGGERFSLDSARRAPKLEYNAGAAPASAPAPGQPLHPDWKLSRLHVERWMDSTELLHLRDNVTEDDAPMRQASSPPLPLSPLADNLTARTPRSTPGSGRNFDQRHGTRVQPLEVGERASSDNGAHASFERTQLQNMARAHMSRVSMSHSATALSHTDSQAQTSMESAGGRAQQWRRASRACGLHVHASGSHSSASRAPSNASRWSEVSLAHQIEIRQHDNAVAAVPSKQLEPGRFMRHAVDALCALQKAMRSSDYLVLALLGGTAGACRSLLRFLQVLMDRCAAIRMSHADTIKCHQTCRPVQEHSFA